jgi:hypothetical protein
VKTGGRERRVMSRDLADALSRHAEPARDVNGA